MLDVKILRLNHLIADVYLGYKAVKPGGGKSAVSVDSHMDQTTRKHRSPVTVCWAVRVVQRWSGQHYCPQEFYVLCGRC